MDILKKIWNRLHKLLHIRFYNCLMLYNTFIFLVVAYVLAFIATRYSMQLDRVKGECVLEGCLVIEIPASGKMEYHIDKA